MRNVSKALASLGFAAVTLIPITHAHSHSRFHRDHEHINGDDIRSLDETRLSCGTPNLTSGESAISRAMHYTGGMPNEWTIDVPTYFHVITNGEEGNNETNVIESMHVLNNAFKLNTATFKFQFNFNLLETTYTNEESWFSERSEEMPMKEALRTGECNALNIYSNSGLGYLGFAYYPQICQASQTRDGVIINERSVPGGSLGNGDTLVHEVGHWLGLLHTFEGGCSGRGDSVDDTPAHEAHSNCNLLTNVIPNTCGGEEPDPVNNYMSYSSDACMSEFTEGQYERMFSQWHMYRRVRLTMSAPMLPSATGTGFITSSDSLRKTPISLCLPYNKKTACKNAGCYWKKSKNEPSTCVSEKPCLEYQKKESCRKHDCHWKSKSLKCLASKPCSLYTRKRACNNAGCMFDKSLSTKCSSLSSSNISEHNIGMN